MKPRADAAAGAARAIERVLRAEQQAAAELVAAREAARLQLEQARDDARACVNRATARIARWQQGHAERLAARVQALRDEAARAERSLRRPDERQIAAVAARVAAELTGGDGGQ